MTSQQQQQKSEKSKTPLSSKYIEDYAGYSDEDPANLSKRQGGKPSSQRSQQPNNTKSASPVDGARNHNGSLEFLNEAPKGSMNAPTFGEEEINAVVAQQVMSAPVGKNMSKIEMMLEEHKKRKAMQNYYEFQNDEESPTSVKSKSSKAEEKSPGLFPKAGDSELLLSPIEPKSLANDNQSAPQTNSAIHSFRFENGKQNYHIQEQYQFYQSNEAQENEVGEFTPGVVSGHEETGRFKGSARSIDFNEKNVSSDLKDKYQLPSKFSTMEKKTSTKSVEKREKEHKRIGSTNSNNLNTSNNSTISNKNTNNNNNDKNNNGIPKISENSRKIFKNSQRAKEDEILIQTLLTAHMRRLSSGENQEASEQQNTVEQKETPSGKGKFIRLPSGESFKSDKDQTKLSINFTTEEKKTKQTLNKLNTSEGSPLAKTKDTNIMQNSSYPASALTTSQRSTSKKAFQLMSESQGFSASSSPKSIRSMKAKTVVELRKSPSRVESVLSSARKRGGNAASAQASPSVKEIKEAANATKQVYLRMREKTVELPVKVESASASPKRKSKNSSPKSNRKPSPADIMGSTLIRKCAENNKTPTVHRLGPEEAQKYDEIQRLDIIMYNLRQMQKANMMAELYTFRMNNPKPVNDIIYTTKLDWAQYADDINEVASERRWFRRMQEEEKIARLQRPPSPRPMEKIDMSVDSLVSSMHLRNKTYATAEDERSNMRTWNESGLYDRGMVWLAVRDHKVNQFYDEKKRKEVEDCSFQPDLITKAYNDSLIGSHNRSHTEAPPSFLNSMTERLIAGKFNSSELGTIAENNIYNNNKSLYKEKKELETYGEIFDLKKAYNLYKIARENNERTSQNVSQA